MVITFKGYFLFLVHGHFILKRFSEPSVYKDDQPQMYSDK